LKSFPHVTSYSFWSYIMVFDLFWFLQKMRGRGQVSVFYLWISNFPSTIC
jgi:hypothetical protein